jgi:hypothetical protein
LVVVVIQPGDVGAAEFCNLSGRSSNTTANVKDLVAVFDANLGG